MDDSQGFPAQANDYRQSTPDAMNQEGRQSDDSSEYEDGRNLAKLKS